MPVSTQSPLKRRYLIIQQCYSHPGVSISPQLSQKILISDEAAWRRRHDRESRYGLQGFSTTTSMPIEKFAPVYKKKISRHGWRIFDRTLYPRQLSEFLSMFSSSQHLSSFFLIRSWYTFSCLAFSSILLSLFALLWQPSILNVTETRAILFFFFPSSLLFFLFLPRNDHKLSGERERQWEISLRPLPLGRLVRCFCRGGWVGPQV